MLLLITIQLLNNQTLRVPIGQQPAAYLAIGPGDCRSSSQLMVHQPPLNHLTAWAVPATWEHTGTFDVL